jgi:hypothetical protein
MHSGPRRRWSTEEEEQCKALLREGYSSREAGIAIGRSKESVAYRNQKIWKIDLSHVESRFQQEHKDLKGTGRAPSKLESLRMKWFECTNPKCDKAMLGHEANLCYRCKKSPIDTCPVPGCDNSYNKNSNPVCLKCMKRSSRLKKERLRKKSIAIKESIYKEVYLDYIKDWVYGLSSFPVTLAKSAFKSIHKNLSKHECSCMSCGWNIFPVNEVHHISPHKDDNDHWYNNLLILCPGCHKAVHRGHLDPSHGHHNRVDSDTAYKWIMSDEGTNIRRSMLGTITSMRRYSNGEANQSHNRKLSDEDISMIRTKHSCNVSIADLSREFDVSRYTIVSIIKRITMKHIK